MGLYKRGKSRKAPYSYRFQWTVENTDGTRETYEIRRSARTADREMAVEAEEEHKRALRLALIHPNDPWPRPPAPQAPKLRDFTERFLEYAELRRPKTAGFYRECINRVLRFSSLADAVLTAVTGESIAKYVQWRKDLTVGNSVASINGELRTLRRLFNVAEEWGIVQKAPAIHELPGQKGRERVISFKDEGRYLQVASATVHDMAILAVDTGLRPDSELFPLEWCNVHLDPSDGAANGYLHVAAGKTEHAVRNVPLTPRAQDLLKARKANSKGNRYVFPGPGRSGHIMTIQHPHERAARNAGLEPFEFYCWRHTFGTRCAESGMDKFTLARLMGHSSPRVAERYYVHVTEPHVTAGFERFLDYHANGLSQSISAPVTATVQ